MIMKRVMSILAAMIVAVGLSACDGLLDVEKYEPKFSTLTEDVNFTPESALGKTFDSIYADYPKHTNLFFELVGPEVDGENEVMILDLLMPNNKVDYSGEYKVGFSGDYIALPQINLLNPANGMTYQGGCYYGIAKNGIVNDYYGFLTEGKVIISQLDDTYYITVDGKSVEHNIYVHYQGPVEIVKGE